MLEIIRSGQTEMARTDSTHTWSPLERLPAELLLKIFLCLPIKDLKSVSLSSYRLYDTTSTEVLWKNATIRKIKVRKNGIQPVLRKRYKTLVSIDLSGIFCVSPSDFSSMMTFIKCSHIKHLNLSCVKMETNRSPRQMPCNKALSKVDPALLSDAVTTLESVNLSGTYLEIIQIIAIFEKILLGTKLTNLVMGGINLVEVPVDLFVNALSKINRVELFETNVSYQNGLYNSFKESQIFGIFRKLEEETVLAWISVFWQNFKEGCAFLKNVNFCSVVNSKMKCCVHLCGMVGTHVLSK